jgi:hypothetical protein
MWTAMLEAMGAKAALPADQADRLAARFELSPAQIKGAVLTARYAAMASGAELNVADLEAGAARELAKEGRSAAATSEPLTRTLGGRRA